MDAGNLVLVNVRTNLGGNFLPYPILDQLIAFGQVLCFFLDHRRVNFQKLPKLKRNGIYVCLGLLQLVGIQIYVLYTDRCGQDIHIAIVNCAPVCCYGRGPGLIAKRQLGIFLIAAHH